MDGRVSRRVSQGVVSVDKSVITKDGTSKGEKRWGMSKVDDVYQKVKKRNQQ
jgi:hypothetical protein